MLCDMHTFLQHPIKKSTAQQRTGVNTGSWSVLWYYCLHVKFTAFFKFVNSWRPTGFSAFPASFQLVMDSVNKILPLLPAWWLNTVIFDSLDVIEFDLHRWLSNQTNHLSLGSERAGEINGCVVHADLFQLNLSPLIYLPGAVVLVY